MQMVRPANFSHPVPEFPNFCLASILLLAASVFAAGQSSLDEVHIAPVLPTPSASALPVAGPAVEKAMKVTSNLVLVPVTITDELNRVVVGLTPSNFRVLEDKKLQEIKHFFSEDQPSSIGIILDVSSSMKEKIEWARDAVKNLLRTANPQDEFFLISFADSPELLADFTHSIDDVQNRLVTVCPRGRTSLLDAVYLGVSKMRQAHLHRKALVIISDGGDNHSRYTESEITSLVKEADVVIYAIGIYDRYFPSEEERLGPELLSDISRLTGGTAFVLDNPTSLPTAALTISNQLRYQYVLGYRPENRRDDGKWRKIKVTLKLPKGISRLFVSAKSGYYAALR